MARREPPPPAQLARRLSLRARSWGSENAPGGADPPSLPPPPIAAGTTAADLAVLAVGLLRELAAEPYGAGSKELAAAGAAGAEAFAALRARAARLLDADALLTYAFEAAAETGPEAVEALAAWLAPGRMAALLPTIA